MSDKRIGVLVFPAGEVNAVELHDALCTCVNIRLYGASSVDRHGEYVFKDYTSGLPMINNSEFLTKFNQLIEEKEIDVIFPTHDTVAEYLSEHREEISAKIIVADKKTAEICRDKKLTFDLFKEFEFSPEIYEKDTIEYPVFIKPRKGQGAKGAFLAECESDIPLGIDLDDMVISEFLPGQEYTVDCFTDNKSELRGVFPRTRDRLLAGVTVNGKTVDSTEEIWYIAKTINDRLRFEGLWYFQIKKDEDGKFKLLEISTRCPGTMCLTRARGINIPLLSVYTAMGRDVDVLCNDYQVVMDRTMFARYKIDISYDTVYLDLDDTLTFDGKVNLNTIRFVYQCYNKGISVILLTRHEEDHDDTVEEYLLKCGISTNLFERIIKIKLQEKKIDYIESDKRFIFIDNAFDERIRVKKEFGASVFDVDNIEVLLDWRI